MILALFYLAQVRSHRSIWEPLHCETCERTDIEFCEYLRGPSEEES